MKILLIKRDIDFKWRALVRDSCSFIICKGEEIMKKNELGRAHIMKFNRKGRIRRVNHIKVEWKLVIPRSNVEKISIIIIFWGYPIVSFEGK